ncbi:hypothetical protein ABT255_61130 [Streptomyces mirabilis]|uniref:hypothetical protein n=1 Tax=Streptomyces mirabilis TaxID=68239 RepID=UPI003333FDC5
MSLPADRTALDLLDAYLEALGDGTDLPLPQGLVRLAAEGGGQLVHWALGRLRRIPCEPKGTFARRAGSLPAEFRSRRCPWNAAALRLLGDTYTFAATGPGGTRTGRTTSTPCCTGRLPTPGLGPAGPGPHQHRPPHGARVPLRPPGRTAACTPLEAQAAVAVLAVI